MNARDAASLGEARQARQAKAQAVSPADSLTPADRYGELYVAVQTGRVYADSKTFVDCVPCQPPQAILQAFEAQRHQPGFDLAAFVQAHFEPTHAPRSDYVSVPGQSLVAHIDGLWPVLTRHPRQHRPYSSLLPVPHDYVIPGGRFVEMYYWDSYFTMLGLQASGRADLLRDMVENFAYLIDTHGHVPNGTRTYYLSRSQPPMFAAMVELLQDANGPPQTTYLPQLLREHAYWMDGADRLAPGEAHRRVLRLADGSVLNRYWDDRDTPREEAFLEDVLTAKAAARAPAEVYRDLRAAAESGWDFSSRWLAEDAAGRLSTDLATICTTSLAPIDLNALLYQLETKIAALSREADDVQRAAAFEQLARQRQAAVSHWLWDEAQGAFFDLAWREGRRRQALTAATAVPLFCGLTTAVQAARVAHTLEQRLLVHGGLSTTEVESGQQWDRPNGWSPLQWMAIDGLRRYGHDGLARTMAHRWLDTVSAVYRREAKLVEKYALRDQQRPHDAGGGGGEYPLQDGFGWSNGVTRWLLSQHPTHGACEAKAAS
ncbi:MAG: alpha,alpha-trehalase TreF [Burkholderiales bacterium]